MLDGVTLGTIQVFPYDRLPSGWMECDGRELPIAQWQALYSLIDTRFGGDGRKTFRLPDLRGRVAVCTGRAVGKAAAVGEERHTLRPLELPRHQHVLSGSSLAANTENVADALPGTLASGPVAPYAPAATRGPLSPMAAQVFKPMPDLQPHENRQPYVVMVYAMAVQADFPLRPFERH